MISTPAVGLPVVSLALVVIVAADAACRAAQAAIHSAPRRKRKSLRMKAPHTRTEETPARGRAEAVSSSWVRRPMGLGADYEE